MGKQNNYIHPNYKEQVMKYLIGAIAVIAALIIGGLIFIYSGVYNISAMDHHSRMTLWMMNTVRDKSIRYNTDDNIKMPDLSDSTLIEMGFEHYREMCAGCHGGPGIEKSEIARGLYPSPPNLKNISDEWTPRQLFWITKNGLKMTGMPGFGPTHPDEKIWAIVAFTKQLKTMTKEQYEVLDKNTKGESDESDGHDHSHEN